MRKRSGVLGVFLILLSVLILVLFLQGCARLAEAKIPLFPVEPQPKGTLHVTAGSPNTSESYRIQVTGNGNEDLNRVVSMLEEHKANYVVVCPTEGEPRWEVSILNLDARTSQDVGSHLLALGYSQPLPLVPSDAKGHMRRFLNNRVDAPWPEDR